MTTFRIDIRPRILHFKQPAGTSRGTYTERKSWFLYLSSAEEPNRIGIGECAPLPNLSCDDRSDYEERLTAACQDFCNHGQMDVEGLRDYPSILFGLESALLHYLNRGYAFWPSSFAKGERGIIINGLIWMGNYESMQQQVTAKLEAGFRCIKLKIGAIDFEKEIQLLRWIRQQPGGRNIELRVDANGAFTPDEAMQKLQQLSAFKLHSIEQPIRAGQWREMAKLTADTPLPIALDEELIGCNQLSEKEQLLDTIQPQYIILKPSLHGGLFGCSEWIREADKRHIGWWVTSALESNIGLNAIAQWCAVLPNSRPQGLGTGALFTDNIEVPLRLTGDELWYDPQFQAPLCPFI